MFKNSKKGVEITTNTLVILVIAIIVLLAVIAIFTGVWSPGTKTTQGLGDFNSACASYAASGCCASEPPPARCAEAPTGGGKSLVTKLTEGATSGGISQPHKTCCRT
ncbi:MAG: hypothetical protein HY366_01405 [Candidatus Aenigmarchaeota archaeon]|nr:hypothetical protein [Candidatus Aenigmarchaeota archaeon]